MVLSGYSWSAANVVVARRAMREAVSLLWIHELHAGDMLPACLWTYK